MVTPKQIILRARARNITLTALAAEIGVAPCTLSKWLHSGNIPPYGMTAIIKILGFEGERDA